MSFRRCPSPGVWHLQRGPFLASFWGWEPLPLTRAAAWMPGPFWLAVQVRTRVPILQTLPVGQVRDGEVENLGAGGKGIAKLCVDIARGRDMSFV